MENTTEITDRERAIKTLKEISVEIRQAWENWDTNIMMKHQPVPIQDLDYWADQIIRAANVLENYRHNRCIECGVEIPYSGRCGHCTVSSVRR